MSKFPKEIMDEVGAMLDGYGRADLEEKMELLCRVTQYLLEKGYEELWVSLCVGPDAPILNVTSGGWDGEEMQRDTLADAARIGADSVVVANDAWVAPTVLTTDCGEDLSVHPARQEGIMVVARDRVQHLVGCGLFTRSGDELVFSDLLIRPMAESWLDLPSVV